MHKVLWQYPVMLLLAVLFVLPREARVLTEGVPGKGWTQTGEINTAVMAARRLFDGTMLRQGWKKQDAFQMKKGRFVTVWKKNNRVITTLIWEKEIARSGFAWGEINTADDKKK